MVEPRHRAIIDGEGETFFGLTSQREPDRGLDRAAVRDGDDVPARLFGIEAINRAFDAIIKIHEAFAARRRIVDRCKPVAADLDRPASEKGRAVQALPLPEML